VKPCNGALAGCDRTLALLDQRLRPEGRMAIGLLAGGSRQAGCANQPAWLLGLVLLVATSDRRPLAGFSWHGKEEPG